MNTNLTDDSGFNSTLNSSLRETTNEPSVETTVIVDTTDNELFKLELFLQSQDTRAGLLFYIIPFLILFGLLGNIWLARYIIQRGLTSLHSVLLFFFTLSGCTYLICSISHVDILCHGKWMENKNYCILESNKAYAYLNWGMFAYTRSGRYVGELMTSLLMMIAVVDRLLAVYWRPVYERCSAKAMLATCLGVFVYCIVFNFAYTYDSTVIEKVSIFVDILVYAFPRVTEPKPALAFIHEHINGNLSGVIPIVLMFFGLVLVAIKIRHWIQVKALLAVPANATDITEMLKVSRVMVAFCAVFWVLSIPSFVLKSLMAHGEVDWWTTFIYNDVINFLHTVVSASYFWVYLAADREFRHSAWNSLKNCCKKKEKKSNDDDADDFIDNDDDSFYTGAVTEGVTVTQDPGNL